MWTTTAEGKPEPATTQLGRLERQVGARTGTVEGFIPSPG
jgi:hypothetical protein